MFDLSNNPPENTSIYQVTQELFDYNIKNYLQPLRQENEKFRLRLKKNISFKIFFIYI